METIQFILAVTNRFIFQVEMETSGNYTDLNYTDEKVNTESDKTNKKSSKGKISSLLLHRAIIIVLLLVLIIVVIAIIVFLYVGRKNYVDTSELKRIDKLESMVIQICSRVLVFIIQSKVFNLEYGLLSHNLL